MTQKQYIVKYTNQFKKDYKSALKRNLNINELHAVDNKLACGETLEEKYRDYALTGQWIGH